MSRETEYILYKTIKSGGEKESYDLKREFPVLRSLSDTLFGRSETMPAFVNADSPEELAREAFDNNRMPIEQGARISTIPAPVCITDARIMEIPATPDEILRFWKAYSSLVVNMGLSPSVTL